MLSIIVLRKRIGKNRYRQVTLTRNRNRPRKLQSVHLYIVCYYPFVILQDSSLNVFTFIRSTLCTTIKLENQEAMRSLNTNTRETCTVSNQDFLFIFKIFKRLKAMSKPATSSVTTMNHSLSFLSLKIINSYFILEQKSILVHSPSFFLRPHRCSQPNLLMTICNCQVIKLHLCACMTVCQPYYLCVCSIFLFLPLCVCALHLV